GDFIMGSTGEDIEAATRMDKDAEQFGLRHETPQFTASTPDYYIGVYAVTNEQFARFLTETDLSKEQLEYWLPWNERIVLPDEAGAPYRVVPGFERHPAINVSWFGAKAYCEWARLRLPTEIEWEKAARGTDARTFPWGDDWRADALRWWSNRPRGETTAPVDAFPEGCSPYGLYQMAGNVEEWCADWYLPEVYERYATGHLRPPTSGVGRAARGGACLRRNKLEFRCAMRRANPPALVNILYTGIRCACDASCVTFSH
ncbi:MAG TPA: SUMF1/EgtB/PvdO family nonheme iron enzyme, partial [Verrucomicrobiae bacterium]|nr:SUMF1/EgtB/PvdO family nonheme iron enzyme [Verrucomicrobiae bacterium]